MLQEPNKYSSWPLISILGDYHREGILYINDKNKNYPQNMIDLHFINEDFEVHRGWAAHPCHIAGEQGDSSICLELLALTTPRVCLSVWAGHSSAVGLLIWLILSTASWGRWDGGELFFWWSSMNHTSRCSCPFVLPSPSTWAGLWAALTNRI